MAAKGRTKAIVSVMVQWSRPRTTPRQPGRTAAGPLSDVTANKEKILSPLPRCLARPRVCTRIASRRLACSQASAAAENMKNWQLRAGGGAVVVPARCGAGGGDWH